jgi:amino acid transporter
VAGSLPAGSMTLALFDEQLADDTLLSTLVGAAWFLLMLFVVLGGARLTVRAQLVMSGVELVILALFVVLALFHSGHARAFDWSWLGFGHFDGVSGFASGALIAAFYYWGWDVTSNLSEETRNSRRTTGLAGLIGVGIVFLLFEVFTIAVNVLLSARQIQDNDANVLALLGDEIWPGWGGKLLIIAVMLSTIATLETTLLQVTRSLFAMGRDGTMPSALGRVHRTWNTPWVAIAVVGAVALLMIIASNALGTVGDILGHAISAIGLQIAVYYGLAGLAVVVAYRKILLKSPANFLLGGVWPLCGALFMFWIFVESLGELSAPAIAIGIGGLAVGLIPMFWYWRQGSDYYRPAKLDATHTVTVDYVPDGRPAVHSRVHEGLPTDF